MIPWVATAPMPPAGVATSGVPGCHHFHHRVRKAIDVARIIVHRRSDSDVRCGQQRGTIVVRNDAEKLHAVPHAGGLRPRPKGCVEIAVPGDGDAERWALRPSAWQRHRSGIRSPSC